MSQIRIALAQTNPQVGDLDGNAKLVVDWTTKAAAAGAHAVIFPEMTLTGYPIEDLAFRESFANASRVMIEKVAARLAEINCSDIAAFVGYLDRDEAGPRNAVAVLHGGHVAARQFKHHLPEYGVFDERRYFVRGISLEVVRLRGVDIGLAICDDLWPEDGPIAAYTEAGVDLIVALNASPYERGKNRLRRKFVARRARQACAPIAYVNMVGGQDELVFDGDSMVIAADGSPIAVAPRFTENLQLVDVDLPARIPGDEGQFAGIDVRRTVLTEDELPAYSIRPARKVFDQLSEPEEIWSTLVVGLRDYAGKNGFRTAVLGLSGGIDSAVVAALAVDALGANAVHGVSMPSAYSSDDSLEDAAELGDRTGLHYQVQPVTNLVSALVNQLAITGAAEEKAQARCRGVILMSLSDTDGHLVLATGNKTELAVGYTTMYGDAVGGFAPIKDISKTQVWELARWRNEHALRRGDIAPIPERSISKPPSAERRPGQFGTDGLPDYELLDQVLDGYVEFGHGLHQPMISGLAPETIREALRMVDRAEYKRRQYPPGTKITLKGSGRDRRLPITNGWQEKTP